jgi:uncharacterized membrane protein YbhN (UPF0104 family)
VGRSKQVSPVQRILNMLTAIVVSVVFSATAHHFWWDSHPGSESAFHQKAPWYGVAGGLLFVAAYVAYGFYQEYWPIFFNSSQEEHNGIQR